MDFKQKINKNIQNRERNLNATIGQVMSGNQAYKELEISKQNEYAQDFIQTEISAQESFRKMFPKDAEAVAYEPIQAPVTGYSEEVAIQSKNLNYFNKKKATVIRQEKQAWKNKIKGFDEEVVEKYGFEIDDNEIGENTAPMMLATLRLMTIEDKKKKMADEILSEEALGKLEQNERDIISTYRDMLLDLGPTIEAETDPNATAKSVIALRQDSVEAYRAYLRSLLKNPVETAMNALTDTLHSLTHMSENMFGADSISARLDKIMQLRNRFSAIAQLHSLRYDPKNKPANGDELLDRISELDPRVNTFKEKAKKKDNKNKNKEEQDKEKKEEEEKAKEKEGHGHREHHGDSFTGVARMAIFLKHDIKACLQKAKMSVDQDALDIKIKSTLKDEFDKDKLRSDGNLAVGGLRILKEHIASLNKKFNNRNAKENRKYWEEQEEEVYRKIEEEQKENIVKEEDKYELRHVAAQMRIDARKNGKLTDYQSFVNLLIEKTKSTAQAIDDLDRKINLADLALDSEHVKSRKSLRNIMQDNVKRYRYQKAVLLDRASGYVNAMDHVVNGAELTKMGDSIMMSMARALEKDTEGFVDVESHGQREKLAASTKMNIRLNKIAEAGSGNNPYVAALNEKLGQLGNDNEKNEYLLKESKEQLIKLSQESEEIINLVKAGEGVSEELIDRMTELKGQHTALDVMLNTGTGQNATLNRIKNSLPEENRAKYDQLYKDYKIKVDFVSAYITKYRADKIKERIARGGNLKGLNYTSVERHEITKNYKKIDDQSLKKYFDKKSPVYREYLERMTNRLLEPQKLALLGEKKKAVAGPEDFENLFLSKEEIKERNARLEEERAKKDLERLNEIKKNEQEYKKLLEEQQKKIKEAEEKRKQLEEERKKREEEERKRREEEDKKRREEEEKNKKAREEQQIKDEQERQRLEEERNKQEEENKKPGGENYQTKIISRFVINGINDGSAFAAGDDKTIVGFAKYIVNATMQSLKIHKAVWNDVKDELHHWLLKHDGPLPEIKIVNENDKEQLVARDVQINKENIEDELKTLKEALIADGVLINENEINNQREALSKVYEAEPQYAPGSFKGLLREVLNINSSKDIKKVTKYAIGQNNPATAKMQAFIQGFEQAFTKNVIKTKTGPDDKEINRADISIPEADMNVVKWFFNEIPDVENATLQDISDFRKKWEQKLDLLKIDNAYPSEVTRAKLKVVIDKLTGAVDVETSKAELNQLHENLRQVDLNAPIQEKAIENVEDAPNVHQWYGASCWAASGSVISGWYIKNVLKDNETVVDQTNFVNPANIVINPYADKLREYDNRQNIIVDDAGINQELQDINNYLKHPENKYGSLIQTADVMLSKMKETGVRHLRFSMSKDNPYIKLNKDDKRKLVKLLFEKIGSLIDETKGPVSLLLPGHYRTVIRVGENKIKFRDSGDPTGEFSEEFTYDDFLTRWEGIASRTGKYEVEMVCLQNLNGDNKEELKQKYGYEYKDGELQYSLKDELKQKSSSEHVIHNLGIQYENRDLQGDNLLNKFMKDSLYVPKNLDNTKNVDEVNQKNAELRNALGLKEKTENEKNQEKQIADEMMKKHELKRKEDNDSVERRKQQEEERKKADELKKKKDEEEKAKSEKKIQKVVDEFANNDLSMEQILKEVNEYTKAKSGRFKNHNEEENKILEEKLKVFNTALDKNPKIKNSDKKAKKSPSALDVLKADYDNKKAEYEKDKIKMEPQDGMFWVLSADDVKLIDKSMNGKEKFNSKLSEFGKNKLSSMNKSLDQAQKGNLKDSFSSLPGFLQEYYGRKAVEGFFKENKDYKDGVFPDCTAILKKKSEDEEATKKREARDEFRNQLLKAADDPAFIAGLGNLHSRYQTMARLTKNAHGKDDEKYKKYDNAAGMVRKYLFFLEKQGKKIK